MEKIRSYCKTRIFEIYPDMKEHDEPIISSTIGDTNLDDTFQIEVGDMVNAGYEGEGVFDSFTVFVRIFGRGYQDKLSNYDTLYCKAWRIRNNCLNRVKWSSAEGINSVSSAGITRNDLDTDDNIYFFEVQLTVNTAEIIL